MPTPYRKHTRMRRRLRRSQVWKLKPAGSHKCSHCGQATQPHRVCRHCGFYDGKLVVPKKVRKSKKQKQQAEGAQEEGEQK